MSARNFIIALATTVSLAAAATHAGFYQFNGTLDNGYSVQGVIETRASAPASFIESNPNFPNAPFATQYVDWLNMSVFRCGSTIAAIPAPATMLAFALLPAARRRRR